MKDVSPELLEELNKEFLQRIAINPQIRTYKKKLEAEKITTRESALYVHEIVNIAVTSVTKTLASRNLPDGKLYWNIAEAVLVPFLKDVIDIMNDIAVKAQKIADRKQKVSIKVNSVKYPEGQIQSYLNMIVRNSLDEEEAVENGQG